MAVINLTPDSFFEGSRFDSKSAVDAAVQAEKSGADIIDLGAQSTAPGASAVTAEQELERLLEPLRLVRAAVNIPISVDTYYPAVARAALENGADIINDVSGTADVQTAALAAEFSAGWIAMHTGGFSADECGEYGSIIKEINCFFEKAVLSARRAGLNEKSLCLDPGIGFGKSRENDLEIINNFSLLESHGCARLAALSRKRVTRLCGDALTGTVAANTACILGGADIIRVHDVEAAVATAEMAHLIKRGKSIG